MKIQTDKHKKVRWYEKNYLVETYTQLKLILNLMAIILIFTTLLCYFSYEWLTDLRPLFDKTIAGPYKPAEAFQIIAQLLLYRLMGIVGIMLLSFLIAAVILTHRLTGPIWKLRRDLTRFFDGEEIEPIRFRKRDEFHYLPPLINRLLQGYKGPRGG